MNARLPVSEAQVQQAILQALRLKGVLAWVVDAGGKRLRGRAIRGIKQAGGTARNAQNVLFGRTDAPAGFPDIVGILPGGRALFLEVKRPSAMGQAGGQPSQEQLAFITRACLHGAAAGIVRSVDEALRIAEVA